MESVENFGLKIGIYSCLNEYKKVSSTVEQVKVIVGHFRPRFL